MLENGHRAVLKLSGGRLPRSVGGMQPLELHTIGRKTGQRRSTLLTDRKSTRLNSSHRR